jgi:hypothetical protein
MTISELIVKKNFFKLYKFTYMKQFIFYFILSTTVVNFCDGQQIESEKVFGGHKYILNGNKMSMKDLSNTLKSNQESFELLKKAKSNMTISLIIGSIGGGLMGYSFGSGVGEGDVNWAVAGVGAGLFAIGIPIASSADKKTKQAVDLYNSTLGLSTYHKFKPEYRIITNGRSIGLSLNF